MTKILFVCHGNICRSPMAEFVFKDLVKKEGIEEAYYINSAATSNEEIGNGVHAGTCKKLIEAGIYCEGHKSTKLTKIDFQNYDFLVGMDRNNILNMKKISGEKEQEKIARLLDFTDSPDDIADPWYTGDFEKTYQDIVKGCKGFLAATRK